MSKYMSIDINSDLFMCNYSRSPTNLTFHQYYLSSEKVVLLFHEQYLQTLYHKGFIQVG